MSKELPNVPTCPVKEMDDNKLEAAFGATNNLGTVATKAFAESPKYPDNTFSVKTPDGIVTVYRVEIGTGELIPISKHQTE